ncbi:matrixin family metalloprotease [Spirillospora sp. CA-255316]
MHSYRFRAGSPAASLTAAVAVTAFTAAACAIPATADGPVWDAEAARPPDWCRPGPGLQAGAMPQVVDLDQCDVRGRVIRGTGGAAAAVPHDGSSVTAHLLRRHGASELEVDVDAEAGTATIVERRLQIPEGRPRQARAPLPACSDTARRLGPVQWPRGTRIYWHYHPGTVARSGIPAGLAATAFSRGVSGAVNARTDCVAGAPAYSPKPDIFARYAGRTAARPNILGPGACQARNGINSFGWTELATAAADTLAVTCTWHVGSVIREADMAVQTRGKRWWTPRTPRRSSAQPVPGCPAGRYEAVSVITHEMLHVLGLQHIEGSRHQNLSMSPYVRTCDDRAATLGSGDYQGLIDLYGAARPGSR